MLIMSYHNIFSCIELQLVRFIYVFFFDRVLQVV